jgi:hypothetical protein
MSTSQKGQIAVNVVLKMLKDKYIPFPIIVEENTDAITQIKGTDIILVSQKIRVQVKHDSRASWEKGDGKYKRGTGNLYLQTQECNPWREY